MWYYIASVVTNLFQRYMVHAQKISNRTNFNACTYEHPEGLVPAEGLGDGVARHVEL